MVRVSSGMDDAAQLTAVLRAVRASPIMINIPAGARVLLATRPVDFRKGAAHSLAALAQDGANRNLPIREARPFRGVGGQFLDRHVRLATHHAPGLTQRSRDHDNAQLRSDRERSPSGDKRATRGIYRVGIEVKLAGAVVRVRQAWMMLPNSPRCCVRCAPPRS